MMANCGDLARKGRQTGGSLVLAGALVLSCSGKDGGVGMDSTPVGIPAGTTPATGTGSASTCTLQSEPIFSVFWTDDGQVPRDDDGDGSLDTGCGDRMVTALFVACGVPKLWRLGMIDATGTWSGESCLTPQTCHLVPHGEHTLREVSDCQQGSVVLGETTLFHSGLDASLTYMVADDLGCYAWGADPTAYEGLGCDFLY